MSRHLHGFFNRLIIRNLCIFGITILGVLFISGFAQINYIVQSQVFAEGISIDGIDVSGMTYEQGKKALAVHSQEILSKIHISLAYAGNVKEFDANELGVTLNEKEILDQAYFSNKDKADSLEQRYNKSISLAKGLNFETKIAVDKLRLHSTLEEYAKPFYKEATDAVVVFNNNDLCRFTYQAEKYGLQIDTEKLINDVMGMLYNKDYSVLEVSSSTLTPKVTENTLRNNTVLIGRYSTIAKYNANRNNNIQLMCNAINGLEIKSGETLSLNDLVGERTEAKGFRPAPAIENGDIVDQIGGGICQLTGTLYNAALLGGMKITERVRHTFPSSYIPVGQDATLNWKDKDLKIKNTSDYSIYIHSKFENQNVLVELYGQPQPQGITIKIQNEIVKRIPSTKSEIRYTSKLPDGVEQIAREAQSGYVVRIYRVFLKNGSELGKELISQDTYPAISKLIFIGNHTNTK